MAHTENTRSHTVHASQSKQVGTQGSDTVKNLDAHGPTPPLSQPSKPVPLHTTPHGEALGLSHLPIDVQNTETLKLGLVRTTHKLKN